jgi:hypothetical protein
MAWPDGWCGSVIDPLGDLPAGLEIRAFPEMAIATTKQCLNDLHH